MCDFYSSRTVEIFLIIWVWFEFSFKLDSEIISQSLNLIWYFWFRARNNSSQKPQHDFENQLDGSSWFQSDGRMFVFDMGENILKHRFYHSLEEERRISSSRQNSFLCIERLNYSWVQRFALTVPHKFIYVGPASFETTTTEEKWDERAWDFY